MFVFGVNILHYIGVWGTVLAGTGAYLYSRDMPFQLKVIQVSILVNKIQGGGIILLPLARLDCGDCFVPISVHYTTSTVCLSLLYPRVLYLQAIYTFYVLYFIIVWKRYVNYRIIIIHVYGHSLVNENIFSVFLVPQFIHPLSIIGSYRCTSYFVIRSGYFRFSSFFNG